MTKTWSESEKTYLDKVAQLPCAICQTQPVVIHHIRTGVGMSQRSSNFLVVPLCPDCHAGPGGIHGDQSYLKVRKLTEMDLLADTIKMVFE